MTNCIGLPTSGRIEMVSDGRRPRRVLAGEGMVTPVKPLVLNEGDGDERLYPGRDRLAPDHAAVRARPEHFRPAMKGDKVTADHLLKLLGRAEREELRAIEQQRRGTGVRPRGDWRLPGPPRERWRLP
jgi:hypothetical protein